MKPMSMRERLLAVIQGRPVDQVPLIMYDDVLPLHQVQGCFGDRIGLLRWSAVHRVVTPNCRKVTEEYWRSQTRWERTTLSTPAGSIFQERAFEPVYNSGSTQKHYVESAQDYEVLWAYLSDGQVVEDFDRYERDQSELGARGLPLPAVERSPYQQLWVEWVGLDQLPFHFSDWPERVERTIELLNRRARAIFEIVYRSNVPLIDFPDNITAPAIGPARFSRYCVPLYNQLADMLADRGAKVFVHMDGDLKPLWQAIAGSRLWGLDSFSPMPDNDTSVAEALALWPDKRLFVNFPSSVHLLSYDEIFAEAWRILEAGGHTGRLEIQFSESVPLEAWRTSFSAVLEAVERFKP